MNELWKPIEGYFGAYQISSLGRVKSLYGRQGRPVHIMRVSLRNGYPSVTLFSSNRYRHHTIHVLVLEAFVGPRPPGAQGAHINGIKTDSRLCNLKWSTGSENNLMKRRHGTNYSGEKHHKAKLTACDVATIRDMLSRGVGVHGIAKQYGVGPSSIYRIRDGKTWNPANGTYAASTS